MKFNPIFSLNRLSLLKTTLPALLILSFSTPLWSAGKYAEGRKVIKLLNIENVSMIFESWEGRAQEASYEKREDCDDDNLKCYTPTVRTFDFSVDKSRSYVINFMRKNLQKEMVIWYRIHRVEPLNLSSDFEILQAYPRKEAPPDDFKRKVLTQKTGSRNFSIYGNILSLEYRGTVKGTYEGLYYDRKRKKVHPFSITDKLMAIYALDIMLYKKPYYIGISKSLIYDGLRDSDLDIFEINLDEEAGAVQVKLPE